MTSTSFQSPGRKVLIRFNPHSTSVKQGCGTVVALQPGAGFGGCDLALVRFRDGKTGRRLVRPISVAFLSTLDAR